MDAGSDRKPNFSAYTSHSMNLRRARFTRKLTLTRSFSAKPDRARSVSPSNRMVLVTAVRLAKSVHQGPPSDKGNSVAIRLQGIVICRTKHSVTGHANTTTSEI